jgi:hypothetical protein
MSNRRNLLVAAAYVLPAAACSAFSNPAPQPNPTTDAEITQAFSLAQIALLAVQMVPGLNTSVVTEAKNAMSALQSAYTTYKAAPAGSTAAQTAVLAAIAAANSFLQSNGLPALLASPAGKAMRSGIIVAP